MQHIITIFLRFDMRNVHKSIENLIQVYKIPAVANIDLCVDYKCVCDVCGGCTRRWIGIWNMTIRLPSITIDGTNCIGAGGFGCCIPLACRTKQG